MNHYYTKNNANDIYSKENGKSYNYLVKWNPFQNKSLVKGLIRGEVEKKEKEEKSSLRGRSEVLKLKSLERKIRADGKDSGVVSFSP